MIWNIALLLLVFGAARRKYNPYASAAVLGLAKGVIYYILSRSIVAAAMAVLIFGGLASAMILLLARVDKKELIEEPYPKYGSTKKGSFKWEYVPISAIIFLLVFGEMLANMFLVW